ncbi:hypothetical protein FB107DRAFT_224527, partial [Schizophyllum commune]
MFEKAIKNAKEGPAVWRGTPDIKEYERFMYDLTTWQDGLGLTDEVVLMVVGRFLAGRAREYYMNHVSRNIHDWTMPRLYARLFEACFPYNYREQLRQELMHAQQGQRRFEDFASDIVTRRERFPTIPEDILCTILWNGTHAYIRARWRGKGLSPEGSSFSRLVKYGKRFER